MTDWLFWTAVGLVSLYLIWRGFRWLLLTAFGVFVGWWFRNI